MPAADLVMYEDDLNAIQSALGQLRGEANARFAFLIDRNGQQLAVVGETGHIDATSLASLTAGNVAATEGLARIIGEANFSCLFHEGERDSLHITPVGRRIILVIAFGETSSLGLVRLRVRQAMAPLTRLLEQIESRAADRRAAPGSRSPLAEITDEDIDNLFSSN